MTRRRFWFRVVASALHPTLYGRCGLLVIAAGVCTPGCASEGATTVGRLDESIIGGTSAGEGDFPAAAAIFIDGALVCSGVLITPKVVLTSNLCFDPNQTGNVDFDAIAKKTTVYVGAIDVTSVVAPGSAVVSIRPDPDDDSPFQKIDHALVELTSASTAIPAAVNADGRLVPLGTIVMLVGYGATRVVGGAPDRTSAGVLHGARSATKSCASFANPAAPKILCLDSSKGSGACDDTGGPSFLRVNGELVVVGTHSRTDAACSQFSIDSRTDTDVPFIGSVLCAADGYCASACGTSPLAADPDCPVRDAGTGGSPDSSVRGDGGASAGIGGSSSHAGAVGSPGSGGTAVGSGGGSVRGAAGAGPIGPGGAMSRDSSAGGATSRDSSAGGATSRDSSAGAAKEDSAGCTCRLASPSTPRNHSLARWLFVAWFVELASRRCSRRRPLR